MTIEQKAFFDLTMFDIQCDNKSYSICQIMWNNDLSLHFFFNSRQKLFFRAGKPVVTVGWLHSGGRYLTDRCETVLPKSKCMEHIRKTHIALHKGVHNTEDGRAGLIPVDLMCTNATVGVPDTCKIFPGSGLVAFDKNAGKWYLGGIVSWGSTKFEHCQTYVKKYPIYTKVFKYIKWIKQNTELKNLKFPDVEDDRIR